MTAQYENPYPKIKVTLLFGLIGFSIGAILGIFAFVQQQKALYDLEHYGKLLQKDTISYELVFLFPFVVIGVYSLLVGGILAYQQTTWRKRFFDTSVYVRLFWASFAVSLLFSVFLMLMGISPFFAVIAYPLQLVFTLISAIFFLPKGET